MKVELTKQAWRFYHAVVITLIALAATGAPFLLLGIDPGGWIALWSVGAAWLLWRQMHWHLRLDREQPC